MSEIILDNIVKRYGEKIIFNGYSDTIPLGKTTVIIGESGKGKTTLINLIMGIENLSAGKISGVPDKISAVFQNDCLFEGFNAISNIRAITGKSKSKDEIIKTLNALGISENDAKLPVCELSGGMKRRVAIARSLVADSELVIMDEPLKGLDKGTKKSVAEYVLKDVNEKSRTLIFITHSPDEISLLNSNKIISL